MVEKLFKLFKFDRYTIVIYIILFIFLIFGLVLAFGPKVTVCADVYDDGIVKGRKVFTYKYFVKGKGWYRSSDSQSSLKKQNGIYEADCVEVQYNKYFPSSASIIDERFVN